MLADDWNMLTWVQAFSKTFLHQDYLDQLASYTSNHLKIKSLVEEKCLEWESMRLINTQTN